MNHIIHLQGEELKREINKIIKIQNIDMSLMRLIKLKSKKTKELFSIHSLYKEVKENVENKQETILKIKHNISFIKEEVLQIEEEIEKLEEQQNSTKKVEIFNALSQSISKLERKRNYKIHKLQDKEEDLELENNVLLSLNNSLQDIEDNSCILEKNLLEGIISINTDGQQIHKERDIFANSINKELFKIYETLLSNKKNSIVMPIENKCCGGCHIQLTMQTENLIKRSESLVFCEHCSRIIYDPKEYK